MRDNIVSCDYFIDKIMLSNIQKRQTKIISPRLFYFLYIVISITGNLCFGLGDYNHDFERFSDINTDVEPYYKKKDEILALVCDRKSADIAAQKITELSQQPEYQNLLLLADDMYGDVSLRARLVDAQLWGSIDLAKVLYGWSYNYYLLKEEKITECIAQKLSEFLFSEMGNITSGGPGFSRDTAWIADDFEERFPLIDGLPFDPASLFPESISPVIDGSPFGPDSPFPEATSSTIVTEEYKNGKHYREYQFVIIFQSKKHLVSQWYVSPEKPGVCSDVFDFSKSLWFIILMGFNIIYILLNILITKYLSWQRPTNRASLSRFVI